MLRSYTDADYKDLKALYEHSEWFGGHFDEARDSQQRLAKIMVRDPDSILVAEEKGKVVGSVSLFEDGRAAWLFRFVVKNNDKKVAKDLYEKAVEVLRERGHEEVLVYAPIGDKPMQERYVTELGMRQGGNYVCYWADLPATEDTTAE